MHLDSETRLEPSTQFADDFGLILESLLYPMKYWWHLRALVAKYPTDMHLISATAFEDVIKVQYKRKSSFWDQVKWQNPNEPLAVET